MTDQETPERPTAVDLITADDVADLNRRSIERSGAFARVAGSVLVVTAAIGVVAWVWLTVRAQMRADDVFGGTGAFGDLGGGMSFADRADLLFGYVALLVSAALTGGVGLGLRLVADTSVARAGGSLTGFAIGDAAPPDVAALAPTDA